ncbi:hypothetical protein RB195_010555 [Necator americanus]|uniref:DUF7627 domain-containing protein n=1 Tax=Necator americanus TaxID=51031 RepID=A0ABR1CYI8_NECAM
MTNPPTQYTGEMTGCIAAAKATCLSGTKVEDETVPTSSDPGREDAEIVNRCAHSICLLCESAQRSLWMKWPELCDEIYCVIKPCITHNQIITGSG